MLALKNQIQCENIAETRLSNKDRLSVVFRDRRSAKRPGRNWYMDARICISGVKRTINKERLVLLEACA